MTTIRCDQKDCVHRGIEVCTADRVLFNDSQCLQFETWDKMLRTRPGGNCRKEQGKWVNPDVKVVR
jgi:hypothetical protein